MVVTGMFTNKPACTIWEKTSVNHAPAYVRHETGAVYWEDTRGQQVAGTDSRSPDDHVFLAIPVGSIGGYIPKNEDRILPGTVEDASPPKDALTVMQVKDFRYGSAHMQHIEVTLE